MNEALNQLRQEAFTNFWGKGLRCPAWLAEQLVAEGYDRQWIDFWDATTETK